MNLRLEDLLAVRRTMAPLIDSTNEFNKTMCDMITAGMSEWQLYSLLEKLGEPRTSVLYSMIAKRAEEVRVKKWEALEGDRLRLDETSRRAP